MRHKHAFLRGALESVLFSCAILVTAACDNSSTSVVDAGAPDASSDGNTGVICGGSAGQTCAASEYCDFPDALCGNGFTGTCQPRPSACPFILDPVCACNDTIYDNDCEAAQAGQDVSGAGNCSPPVGAFACGDTFCMEGTAYCERQASDVAGTADGYACKPHPAACNDMPSCACLADEPCGATCTEDAGNLTLTCIGG